MVDFDIVTAPHKIRFDASLKQQKKSNDEVKQNYINKDVNVKESGYLPKARAWWISSDDGTHYEGMVDSLKYIAQIMEANGPYDGILGFSQGGVLLSILCLMQKCPNYFAKTFNLSKETIENCARFKFAWIVSGFMPRCDALKPLLNEMKSSKAVIDNIPLLLVIGKNDKFVPNERTLDIINYFDEDNVSVIEHGGNHWIPYKDSQHDIIAQYVAFLSKQTNGACNSVK